MKEKYPLVLLKESEELILKTEEVKSLTYVWQPDLISETYNFWFWLQHRLNLFFFPPFFNFFFSSVVFSCLFKGNFWGGRKDEHDFLLKVSISLCYFASWHLLCHCQLEKYLLQALTYHKMVVFLRESTLSGSFLGGGGNRGNQNTTQFLSSSSPLLSVCLKNEPAQNLCSLAQ